MYFEETDWCYRMKAAGGEVYYCPTATVAHFGGGEIGHYDEFRLLQYHRSLLLFYQKHYSAARSIGVRAILAMRAIIRTLIWLAVAAARPAMKKSALSSVMGYVKVFGIMFHPLGQP
jgi:GT2 family glycosyltransferase